MSSLLPALAAAAVLLAVGRALDDRARYGTWWWTSRRGRR